MVKTIRRRAGYTLLELMMVVAIIGGIFMVGPRIFTATFQFFSQSVARTDIQRELRSTLIIMNRTIRQASAASISVSQDSGQPPYSKITFTTIDGRSVTYKQSGRSLLQIVGTSSTILTQNLQYLVFSYPQTDINTVLSISITLQKNTYSGRQAALQMAITKVRIMAP